MRRAVRTLNVSLCTVFCWDAGVFGGRYAAESARGGVLEANGAASIKFRDRDLLKTGEYENRDKNENEKIKCGAFFDRSACRVLLAAWLTAWCCVLIILGWIVERGKYCWRRCEKTLGCQLKKSWALHPSLKNKVS